jgi:hypothetical protein
VDFEFLNAVKLCSWEETVGISVLLALVDEKYIEEYLKRKLWM